MPDDIQAQTADGITHSFPAGTPDEVVDRAIKGYLSTQANGVDVGDLQNRTQQQSRQQLLKPLSQPSVIDAWQNRPTPADVISKGLGDSIAKNDRAALQQANTTGKAPEGQVWGGYGPRMVKSVVDAGRSAVAHPLLTAGIAAANTNPITAVPVDAALAVHGGMGMYQHRQALKDLVNGGNPNPDELEAGLNSSAEAVGGTAGFKGNLAPARAALRPSVPDQNVAIQKSLDPGWGKREAFQRDVQGARPYLGGQGVKGVSDLQKTIPGVENEIWKPYGDALKKFGNEPVEGPSGPTTYNQLEARRVEISKQLDSIRQKDPFTQQQVLGQGKTPETLVEEQKAIEPLIDERMQQEGVNSPLIRRTIGNVKGVERQVSGTNTLSEEPQRYGFGRMAKDLELNPFHPLRSIGNSFKGAVAGGRDIAAGRPLWRGKPTDVGVAEGLQSGAPKPSFQNTVAPQPLGPQGPPPAPSGPPPPVMPKFAVEGTGRPTNANITSQGRVPSAQVTQLPTEHPGEGDYAGLLPGPPAPFQPLPPGPPVPQVGQPPSMGFPPTMPDTMWTGRATPPAPTWELPVPNQPFTTPSGAVVPPPPPVVPSNSGTGATPPSAPPAAPNVSAPSSASAPPVLPPVPAAPINPQEVSDYSQMLGRPVTAEEIPIIRARLDAERNVNAGLAGNRTDQVGAIRESHRATLTQPKRR